MPPDEREPGRETTRPFATTTTPSRYVKVQSSGRLRRQWESCSFCPDVSELDV
jgi:hypothetical protein